ncbi:MAG TPA: hypothetical protein VMD09_12215 [Solirubrobacteraceae bacterium]|nr:hypothetical protein [Solirubrobacteraceae bacterium]
MPKATSVKPGTAPAARKASTTERNAATVVESARAEAERVRRQAHAEAAQIRAEAEEHARRLVLDARATADGVRAEGMEVVSNLRQISDALREMSERVLRDVQAIHTRMVGELERADPTQSSASPEPASGESDPELDVPDFVARG